MSYTVNDAFKETGACEIVLPSEEEDLQMDRINHLSDEILGSMEFNRMISALVERNPFLSLSIRLATKQIGAMITFTFEAGRLFGRQELIDEELKRMESKKEEDDEPLSPERLDSLERELNKLTPEELKEQLKAAKKRIEEKRNDL